MYLLLPLCIVMIPGRIEDINHKIRVVIHKVRPGLNDNPFFMLFRVEVKNKL